MAVAQNIPTRKAHAVSDRRAVRWLLGAIRRGHERAPGVVLSTARSPAGDEVRFEYLVEERWRGDAAVLARKLVASLDPGDVTEDARVQVDVYRGDITASELGSVPLLASAAR